MKTARIDRTTIRENRLSMAISNSEKDRLEKKATQMGISMSALTRMIINRYLEKEGV